jgi:hypothetical protein
MRTVQITSMTCAAMMTAATVFGQDTAAAVTETRQHKESKWRAQVGWVHQWDRGMTVSGPDRILSISIIDGYNLRSGRPGLTYPDNNELSGRTFDNGYVLPDYWTGDASLLEGPAPERYGMTWNWGVDHADQYHYDGGNNPTLTFHIDPGIAVVEGDGTMTGSSRNQDSGMPVDGIEIKLNRLLHTWVRDSDGAGTEPSYTNTDLDMVVRLAWFPTRQQRYQRSSRQQVLAVREVYTYEDYYGGSDAVGGPYPPLDVPYAGAAGNETDAGPLIPVAPVSSRQSTQRIGSLHNSLSLRSDVWRLRGAVGLEVVKPFSKRLRLHLSPQFVLEVVNMDVERTETVTYTNAKSGQSTTVAAQVDRNSKTTLVPGLLLSAGLDYRFTENWFLHGAFGWEWLTKNPSVRVGPNRVRFDLEGGEFNLALGRRF